MDIKKLFSGIAVIIDNEIEDPTSTIYKIKTNLTRSNIPTACFHSIPNESIIESFGGASFVILDWNFYDLNKGEMMIGSSELQKEYQREVIDFIKTIMEKLFIPVFIFSGVDIDEVKNSLMEEGFYDERKPGRIFIRSKTDIGSEEELFQSIEEWVRQVPSVYVLKELEYNLRITKNRMFTEWYKYSPQWVNVIWKMLKEDSSEVQQEFGEFIVRNLANRAAQFSFDEELFELDSHQVNDDELAQIMEYERYIKYGDIQPEQAYTGDLFKKDRKYYLNVRAQCDLSRKSDKVELYLIEGKELNPGHIITGDIRITSEGELKFPDKAYKLEELHELSKRAAQEEAAEVQLMAVNDGFARYRNQVFFGHGEIREKKPEAIIACVDGGKIIRFRLDLKILKFKDVRNMRIGRILPPYITRIQQKCAQYIVREGTIPLPGELFGNMEL